MTKDQAIAQAIEDIERYQVKRQDFDRFSGTLLFLKEAQTPAPDFDEAALIAKGWVLQDCKVCGESASAYVAAPAPDCRTCVHLIDSYNTSDCDSLETCTNGDKYEAARSVVLWRTE